MLRIIQNDIKGFFTNKPLLFWGFLFPVILVALLGNALSSSFPSSARMNDLFKGIKIEYVSNADAVITTNFDEFLSALKSKMNIEYSKGTDIVKSIEKVKAENISIAVEIKADNEFIITKSRGFKAELAENLINIFAEKYNIIETVSKHGNPELINDVMQSFKNSSQFTKFVIVNRDKRDMTAMDYYGIANVFAMAFWIIGTILFVFDSERKKDLLGRIRIAGISKTTYLLSKLISTFLFMFISSLILLLFNIHVLKAYAGDNLFSLIVLLASACLLVSSIGTLVIALFQKLEKGVSIVEAIVPFLVFLGGGINPIMDFSPNVGLNSIAKITPLFVQTKAAFAIVAGANLSVVTDALLYNLALTVIVFIAAATIFNRKEEN